MNIMIMAVLFFELSSAFIVTRMGLQSYHSDRIEAQRKRIQDPSRHRSNQRSRHQRHGSMNSNQLMKMIKQARQTTNKRQEAIARFNKMQATVDSFVN